MRGIGRVVAAFLLAGGVAGAAVFAHQLGSEPGGAPIRIPGMPASRLTAPLAVVAAPAPPLGRPRLAARPGLVPSVLRRAAVPAASSQPQSLVLHRVSAAPAQPEPSTTAAPPSAPAAPTAPTPEPAPVAAPVAAPAPQPAAAAVAAAAPVVSADRALAAVQSVPAGGTDIGNDIGNDKAKGHDRRHDGHGKSDTTGALAATPLPTPSSPDATQVQADAPVPPDAAPVDTGDGNGHEHGHSHGDHWSNGGWHGDGGGN